MTARAAFLRAVGPQLLHCTARSNLSGIHLNGLMPPALLAQKARRDPAALALRRDRVLLTLPDSTSARLNHQLPILQGLAAANRIIDGHDVTSWARQLDARVFFWPAHKGRAFADSIRRNSEIALIWFDSGALFDALGPALWLSPINSGNFRQGGARTAWRLALLPRHRRDRRVPPQPARPWPDCRHRQGQRSVLDRCHLGPFVPRSCP